MRFSRLHTVSASTFITTLLITSSTLVSANPYPRLASNSPVSELANALEIRACANPCGYYGQVCCPGANQCYTDSNNQASCATGSAVAAATAAAGAGATVTVTVYADSTAAATAATCNLQLGQVQCGSTCCGSGQFCNSGACMNNGATTGGLPAVVATATVSAAIRPTSITTYTVLTTNGATTTLPFLMPATASASSTGLGAVTSTAGSSLSGGAIAGIVIGVLAAIIILILIIICCCARGLLDLFRPKRKTEVTEVYEGRHHSGGSSRPNKRFGLFGGGGGGGGSGEKKSGFLGIAGILAAVALVLGLKRRHDRKNEEKESTAYTYSDYTYDYSTSASSESSDDRRTRRSDGRSRR